MVGKYLLSMKKRKEGMKKMNVVDPIRKKEYINGVKRVLRESGTRNLLLFILGINTELRVSDFFF